MGNQILEKKIDDTVSNELAVIKVDYEIDLLDLWRILLKGKWIIFSFTVIFSTISIVYALSLPNLFTSTAVLAPAGSAKGVPFSGVAGQLGGLASLAGISLDGGGGAKTAEALEVLKSWAFVEEFIREQDIAPQVFAVIGWNPVNDELEYDPAIYNYRTKTWLRAPEAGKGAEPSSWELYEKFQEYFSVTEDKATGFTSVSIEYYSPLLAKKWNDMIIKKINSKVRSRDLVDAEKNIAFLRGQIEETTLASMQSVFFELIEEQTKTLMLAKGSEEYVFKTINEPRVPEQRSRPKRALICIFAAGMGFVFGVATALVLGLRK